MKKDKSSIFWHESGGIDRDRHAKPRGESFFLGARCDCYDLLRDRHVDSGEAVMRQSIVSGATV